ncbi:hypothetical protein JCM10908_004545 [Rhodotorula pacifica]|uniref:uncharacterized protein n=1 Tax=Rhodotorula pacifica TaxID=1495444 RepID=UPI00316CCFBA
MAPLHAFRSPVQNLADFLRSLADPRLCYGTTSTPDAEAYEWEALRARQGGTKRLDFHDHGLRSPEGAVTVLRAVERSPAVTALTLSHNPLGDGGLRELLVGMKRLRARDIGSHLEELNLSGCGLTDVSLHLLALHVLRPSPHPPSLRSLSLNNNEISLGANATLSSLPEFFAATLSAPESSLRSLTVTSNLQITSKAFIAFLNHLDLSSGPSQLAELRLSVTRLSPECADPLVKWLENPTGGARLQVLALNSCGLGLAGVRHIQRAVVSGRVRNLLHLELMANDQADVDGDGSDTTRSHVTESLQGEAEAAGENFHDWDARLKAALMRNRAAWLATRRAALALLGPSRICFGGQPQTPDSDGTVETTIRQEADIFPFLHLPVEVQVHILRCLLFLVSPTTSSSNAAPNSEQSVLSAALTEAQFLRVLAHASSRATLAIERRIATAGGAAPSLNGVSHAGSWQRSAGDEDPASGWEEWFLLATGCDRFG